MVSDDESDLTEVESSEEEYRPTQKKGGRKRKGKDDPEDEGYRIRGALKVPRVANYTTQHLHDEVVSGDIDLCPEYQRDVVWPPAKQMGLIDSLFRNFYVPPVIFVVETRDDGSQHRTCVDGKQRLTSIIRFIDGEIPYKDPHTADKFFYQLSDKAEEKPVRKKVLPDRYKKLFRGKQIVCIEYENIKPENEREIFQRVQLGMALTPAEKLQAISSIQGSFVREILRTYVSESLAISLDWDISRANDFKLIAMAVRCMELWPKTDVPSSIQVSKWLETNEEMSKAFQENVRDAFRVMEHIARDKKLKAMFAIHEGGKSKKIAPVEFIASCVLVWLYKEQFTLPQLAESIKAMRKDIRHKEKDIRMNNRCTKIVLEFVLDLKQKKQKPTKDPVASKAVPSHSGTPKRKKVDSSDEESDDEEYQPSSASAKKPKRQAATKKSPPVKAPPTPNLSTSAASTSQQPTPPATLPTLPNLPLPRSGLPPDSGPRQATSDPRLPYDIMPKSEPPLTPSLQHAPFPTPPLYPTNWPGTQSIPPPTPTPNMHVPPQAGYPIPDRLAALRAAKEVAAASGNVSLPRTPAAPRAFFANPPGSQPTPSAVVSSIMSRMAFQESPFGQPNYGGQDWAAYNQTQSTGHGQYNGTPTDPGWQAHNGYQQ